MSRNKPKDGTPTHKTHPREYSSYCSMKARCLNGNSTSWKHYGGRPKSKGGPVTICKRWMESFSAFVEDMGPRPEGTTLDRINGLKGYTEVNTRWADKKTQAVNRSFVTLIEMPQGAVPLNDASIIIGKKPTTVYARRGRGYVTSKALLADLHVRKKMADKHDAPALHIRTLKFLAKEAGVDYETVRARLDAGLPLADALKRGHRKTSELAMRAAENGVEYMTAYRRVRSGMTIDEAVRPGRAPLRENTQAAAARKLGISKAAITRRLKAGWTYEQATTLPKSKRAA